MPRKKQQLEPDDSRPESQRRITEEIILDTQRVWSPRYAVGVVCALTVLLWAPAALAQVPRAGSDGPGEAPDEWVQAMIAWRQGFAAWQKETSSPRQAVFNVGFRVVCNAPKALAALDPASTGAEGKPHAAPPQAAPKTAVTNLQLHAGHPRNRCSSACDPDVRSRGARQTA
jgi:hypothetical protein